MQHFFKFNFKLQACSLILITAISYALLLNNINLWSDEIYSVLMAKDSFKDMFHLLMTEDSKPPLYYLYLKGILALFPLKYEIFAAHFGSYLLLLATQLFAITAVRKDYGDKLTIWFLVLTLLMPYSLWLAFEVRTYMLSALLMFMALIYGLRLLKKPHRSDYIKLGLTTLAALYTHYYCALWLMFMFGFLFALLLKNKNKDGIKALLLTVFPVAVCFTPWLFIPFSTGGEISKYWYVNYDFVRMSPMFFYDPLAPDIWQSLYFVLTFLGTASLTFVILTGAFNFFHKKASAPFYIALGSFLLTYGLLIVLSFVFRPMVTSRYLKIFTLIWYFAGAWVLSQEKILQKSFLFFAVIGFIGSYIDVRYAFFDRGYQNVVRDIRAYVSNKEPIAVLDNANLFVEYYLPEYKYYLIADDHGEVLRAPSALKNFENYVPLQQRPAVLVVSLMTKLSNPDRCKMYKSLYRFSNSGVNLCYHPTDVINDFLDKSLKLRFHK